SMPKMLREEAFHLAAGVLPMRRWVTAAAEGEVYITIEMLQKTLNKWLPRGLEMFGDERGGGSNVRMGLKPMKNAEAQQQYYDEVAKLVDDLNMRYVRARLPKLSRSEAEALIEELGKERTPRQGIAWEDLLQMPDQAFFRRRGVQAFTMTGFEGETYEDLDDYLQHLRRQLPESYFAGRDFKDYLESLREVISGEIDVVQASRKMPALRRVAGACPCSRAVRWVADEPLVGQGNGGDAAA
ncbi:MAG: hypothetical protein V3T72_01915, partial [Thermoanaerobaculia bacterium]